MERSWKHLNRAGGGHRMGVVRLRVDRKSARVNKRLRMEVYLGQTPGAPAGYKGRLNDEAACGNESAPGARAPSFAEQERQSREPTADETPGRQ